MRSPVLLLAALLLALLSACTAAAPKPPVADIPPTPELAAEALFPQLNAAALEGRLPDGDWEALQGFLPILQEGASFAYTLDMAAEEPESESLTLAEYCAGLPTETGQLLKLTLQDLDGDGGAELILCIAGPGSGDYLVLKREEDAFYGVQMVHRGMNALQTNGVFVGSSGAASNHYCRLYFENGIAALEILGYADSGEYAIAGQTVTEEEFSAWTQELMAGDAAWYTPEGEQAP